MASLRQFFWDRYKSLETAEHRLLYLFLEVTRACQLSCRHCGSDCGALDRRAGLTADHWFSIVDAVSARYAKDLVFVITGGEPLAWPPLAELGGRIQARGRRWGMVTNGFALDAQKLDELIKAGIASITVSLDGDETAHNWLRGHAQAHERALRAVRLVGASPIAFRDVVTCVFPGNLNTLNEIAAALIDARMPAWRLFRIFPLGRAKADPALLLDRERSWRLVDWIRTNRPKYAKAGLTVDLSCEGWLPFAVDKKVRTEPFFCRAGVNIATIRCDGVITGCANNGPAFFEGNIFADDFAEIWERGFRKLRNREWMRRGICAACRDFTHCRGGPAHLWDEDGRQPAFCYMRG